MGVPSWAKFGPDVFASAREAKSMLDLQHGQAAAKAESGSLDSLRSVTV
jgi:hypothetical protein